MKEKQLQLLLGASYTAISLVLTYFTYSGLILITTPYIAIFASILIDAPFYLGAYKAMEHFAKGASYKAYRYLFIALLFGLLSATSGIWGAKDFFKNDVTFNSKQYLESLASAKHEKVKMKTVNLDRFLATIKDKRTRSQLRAHTLYNSRNWVSKQKTLRKMRQGAKSAYRLDKQIYANNVKAIDTEAKSVHQKNSIVREILGVKKAEIKSAKDETLRKQNIIKIINIVLFFAQWIILYLSFWIQKHERAEVVEVKSFFVLPIAVFVHAINFIVGLIESAIGYDIDGNGVVGVSEFFKRNIKANNRNKNRNKIVTAGASVQDYPAISDLLQKYGAGSESQGVATKQKQAKPKQTETNRNTETETNRNMFSHITDLDSLRTLRNRAFGKRDLTAFIDAYVRKAEINGKDVEAARVMGRKKFIEKVTNGE